ncbi:hypothetical protein O9X81_05390 [Agrobacterium salinitolerans]|uniref:hypothetical protein n=1 Tax=Agrobacterium salinitolerans TaxID=1183413 RepID=UPI0022B80F1C|nr:hypothetical protein [Agrobacterium salinitolerans]MCZ7856040.1 hypothetical protein [Agrobacterium salinitolerans]
MPSAFSTTNTQEADDAEIVALAQVKSATRRATEINVSLQRTFTQTRIGIEVAIVVCGSLLMASVVAMIEAERYYAYHDTRDQEPAHVARR